MGRLLWLLALVVIGTSIVERLDVISTALGLFFAQGERPPRFDPRAECNRSASVKGSPAMLRCSETPVMVDFSVRSMNWAATPSAWQQNQAWRDRQQQIRESFESASVDAGAAFFGA